MRVRVKDTATNVTLPANVVVVAHRIRSSLMCCSIRGDGQCLCLSARAVGEAHSCKVGVRKRREREGGSPN